MKIKKLLFILLVIPILVINIVLNVKDVELHINQNEIPVGNNIVLTIVNNSSKQIFFGEPYSIQKKFLIFWVPVKKPKNTGWPDIAYFLISGKEKTQVVYLTPKKPGHYRVVKYFTFREQLSLPRRISAEFHVIE